MYISGSSTISPGGSSAYQAYAKYNGHSALRLPGVIWSAAPEDVAYISENGTVDALAKGTAVITAISGDLKATKTITVATPQSSATLKLSKTTFIYNGKVQKANVTGYQVRYSTKMSMKNGKTYYSAWSRVRKVKTK